MAKYTKNKGRTRRTCAKSSPDDDDDDEDADAESRNSAQVLAPPSVPASLMGEVEPSPMPTDGDANRTGTRAQPAPATDGSEISPLKIIELRARGESRRT